jgi:uncharacterized membrane protein YhfC
MSISPTALVGGSGMILVALGVVAYGWARRLDWRYLVLGALAWIVTVGLKVAFAISLSQRLLAHARVWPEPWATVATSLAGGVLTGVFEVGLVWLVLRYTLLGRASWNQAFAFGAGFGAIEALLLGLVALTGAIVAMNAPQRLPEKVLEQMARSDNLLFQLAPIWERVFACLGHIAANVMIFYAVVRRAPRWIWLAFVYKSAIDAVAVIAHVKGYTDSLGPIWGVEAVVCLWGIAGLLVAIWIKPRYPQTESLPSVSSGPT